MKNSLIVKNSLACAAVLALTAPFAFSDTNSNTTGGNPTDSTTGYNSTHSGMTTTTTGQNTDSSAGSSDGMNSGESSTGNNVKDTTHHSARHAQSTHKTTHHTTLHHNGANGMDSSESAISTDTKSDNNMTGRGSKTGTENSGTSGSGSMPQ